MRKTLSNAEVVGRMNNLKLAVVAESDESSAPAIAALENICETQTQADILHDEYGSLFIGAEGKEVVNQFSFATRYVENSGAIHDPSVRRFFVYDSNTGLWQHQTDDATITELGKLFQKIVNEVGCTDLLKKRTASSLTGLRELARGIAEQRNVFGMRNDVVHVANGMLRFDPIGNIQLLPFAPKYYSRNRSEYKWDSKAECPRFLNDLLAGAMPLEDMELLQKYFGQCLLGTNPSQTFLVLRGTPGGGKSTLVNIIEGIIGRHNVTELRLSLLTERFEVARYLGRTLLSAKDVPGDFLNMRPAYMLKALVGGDTLEGEVKHGNESFAVKGAFNIIISTNTRLRVKLDSDAGAWRRRMLIVDYSRAKPDKAIRDFDDLLLRTEGPGILHWALEGARLLLKDLDEVGHIRLTEGQEKRVEDLLSESDSVRTFLQEMIECKHGAELTVAAIVAKYRDYCEARDWEPLRDKQFQRELPDAMLDCYRAAKRNDIKSEGTSVRGFRGVAFRNTQLNPSDASENVIDNWNDPFSDDTDGLHSNTHIVKKSNFSLDEMLNNYGICSDTSSDPSEMNPFE